MTLQRNYIEGFFQKKLFSTLFRLTEEENLQHVSCKGPSTRLSAVALSSCVLVSKLLYYRRGAEEKISYLPGLFTITFTESVYTVSSIIA